MADNTPGSSDGNTRDKPRSECHSLSQVMKLLGLLDDGNSEFEDLSDIDDSVGDADYQPPRQEPSSSEEDSSGCEDPIPRPSKPVRGRKRHRDERESYPLDRDSTSSHTPRSCSQTQQDNADVSNNIPEDITPEPSNTIQTKKGRGMRWKANPLIQNQSEFEHEDETEQDREGWTPSDYMEQYIDKELMKMIADCSNATSLARDGVLINTSTDEIYHFFGACILMSCIPYPEIKMYWSRALKFDAITQTFTRDRFFILRRSIKVLIDEDVPQEVKECDKFWKVRPFLNRILKGCKSQARPQCVSIDEQIIPFTGACPCRQYLPMKPNPVGMKNFVCATADGIVLDFHIYQGADALLEHVEEPENLGLGGLVIDYLSQTLHPNTHVYCDRFFTTIQCVERMMKKQIYVTGTVMKTRIASAVQKLPDDKSMQKNGRGTSAQVTTEDGKICVVKWYDNKPVLMMSTVHEKEPEDTCQRWDKKLKRYVIIPRPSIVREYNSKMGGVDLVDRLMSYYRLSGRSKKWTLRMMMHFTDLALANSWLLYRKDHTVRGTPKKNILQFLEFRMDVAITFLSQLDNDNSEFSQQEDDEDDLVHGKKRSVMEVPHVSVRRREVNRNPKSILQSHQSIDMREKSYTYLQCGRSFTQRSALKVHQYIHSAKEPHCLQHGNGFTEDHHLKSHQHIPTGERSYQCSECGKSFLRKSNLLSHQRIHTGEKPYQCSQCGKSFSEHGNLKRHHSIHTGERPYECTECGKSFRQKSVLQNHERIHTGEKPYQCLQCGKSFNKKCILQDHEHVHTEQRPYQCSQCGKSFKQKNSLQKHERIHTGLKPYQCSQCGKSFTEHGNLKTHQRIHTGEKLYQCSQCGKSFKTKSILQDHEHIHTGKRPYQCSQCEKSFLRKTHLQSHQHIHA